MQNLNQNFYGFMGKLHNHESKTESDRRGAGVVARRGAPPIDVKSKAELLPQLG